MTTETDWRAEHQGHGYWGVFDGPAVICSALTEQQARLIAAAPAKAALCEELADALEKLLPVAQHFEKQASRGSGGRRGYAVFNPARAALTKAGRAPQ